MYLVSWTSRLQKILPTSNRVKDGILKKKEKRKKERKKKKIKKNLSARRKHLRCLKWRDARDVFDAVSMPHSFYNLRCCAVTRRASYKETKPDVVLDYNIHKAGMNRSDQVTAYYPEIVENIVLSPIYN